MYTVADDLALITAFLVVISLIFWCYVIVKSDT